MARDRASLRIDMWADSDFRGLSMGAQHLYMLLLSHPTLTYAGVADWRVGRLAAMTAGRGAAAVRADADELQRGHFVLVDEATEEVLVRSFVKHDGLMKQPKLAVAMANAYAAIASEMLRQVLAFEVQKLFGREPELSAWQAKQVRTILEAKASGIESFVPVGGVVTPAFTPDVTPGVTPAVRGTGGQALAEPTTTATTTATSSKEDGGRASRSTSFPKGWAPTDQHRKLALELGVDLVRESAQFRDYHLSKGSRFVDWDRAFNTWLRRAEPMKVQGDPFARQSAPVVPSTPSPGSAADQGYCRHWNVPGDCGRCEKEGS